VTEACARIVERDDRHLHATALLAPEPARTRLMVLYAFDIELSRAAQASAESLIPRMRLQFWRDVIAEAAARGAPKAHEVAGPLAEMIRADACDVDLLTGMVDGHEAELDLPLSDAGGTALARDWFGGRTVLAAGLLTGRKVPAACAEFLRREVGSALADGYGCRTAARRIAAGQYPVLRGLAPADVAALTRHEVPEAWRVRARDLAAPSRAGRRHVCQMLGRRAVPALLPLVREARALERVRADPAAILGGLDDLDRPFDGLRMAWRAVTGRW